MAFAPEVFLIGAQKAGTTSLATLLDAHPRIQVARPKEPHYFTQNVHLGEGWYRACFKNADEHLLVDASTSYTSAPLGSGEGGGTSPMAGVAQRLRAHRPDARFIYIVREPVARTYSAYWHNVRNGDESLSFRDALEADDSYLRVSDYSGQLALYLEHFDLQAFFITTFERFSRDPHAVVRDCYRFLGLPDDIELSPKASETRNRSYTYNPAGRLLARMLGESTGLKYVTGIAKRSIPPTLYNLAGQLLTRGIPPISPADRAELEEYFRPRNRRFREMTGIGTGYAE